MARVHIEKDDVQAHNPNERKQLMIGHLAGSMIGSAGYLQNGGTVAAWLQRSPQLAQVTGGAR
jgi:hypothetical protein